MKLVNRWLGCEIIFVQVGHGLLGAAALGLIASHSPWWLTLSLTPLVLFSLAYWLMEASFVMPVARRLLRGETATTTKQPRGHEHPLKRAPRAARTDTATLKQEENNV